MIPERRIRKLAKKKKKSFRSLEFKDPRININTLYNLQSFKKRLRTEGKEERCIPTFSHVYLKWLPVHWTLHNSLLLFRCFSEKRRKRPSPWNHQVLEGHEPDINQFTNPRRTTRRMIESCVWDKRHVDEDRKNRVEEKEKESEEKKGHRVKGKLSFLLSISFEEGYFRNCAETPVAEDGHSAQGSDCDPFYWHLSHR